MGDLISRSALISKLTEKAKKQTEFIAELAFFESAKMAQEMPTVEAEPVVHGEWITRITSAFPTYRCSCCELGVIWKTNYCPNCGAKMRDK